MNIVIRSFMQSPLPVKFVDKPVDEMSKTLVSFLAVNIKCRHILSINSYHWLTKFLQPTNLTTYTILSLFSLQVELAWASLVTLARPSISSSLQITNALSHMHHLTCGISSLLHSVNLVLFTVLLVHLILRISSHHSHHLRSNHPSLPLPFTPHLKLISFTNPFLHSHSYSFRTDFTYLNLYWIIGALFCFSFWLRVLD